MTEPPKHHYREAALIAAYEKHGSLKRAAKSIGMRNELAGDILRALGVLAPPCKPSARPPRAPRKVPDNLASWAYREPTPAVVIGQVTDPDKLAARIMRAVADLGAVQLIRYRGRFAAAIPGSRISVAAERAEPCAIVGTYVCGVSRTAVLEDIRHEMEAQIDAAK